VGSFDQGTLRAAMAAGRFEWSLHALERMARRGIRQDDVARTAGEGERIEDYPEDRPYQSALFLGSMRGAAPLHVAAYDAERDCAYVITAYVPDAIRFEVDWKTRRKP
jgi:hypothetical protein